MGEKDISEFLSYLAIERNVAASTQNQALNSLIFLYKEVLKLEVGKINNLTRAKTPERLPVVLTKSEVVRLLSQLNGVSKVIGILLYGAGLRLNECLKLRVKDIDFDKKFIFIRGGKGQKRSSCNATSTSAEKIN